MSIKKDWMDSTGMVTRSIVAEHQLGCNKLTSDIFLPAGVNVPSMRLLTVRCSWERVVSMWNSENFRSSFTESILSITEAE